MTVPNSTLLFPKYQPYSNHREIFPALDDLIPNVANYYADKRHHTALQEQALQWAMGIQMTANNDKSGDHHRPDFDEFGADCRACGLGQFGAFERHSVYCQPQSVCHRGNQKPPPLHPPAMSAQLNGKQHHLFFDPTLHLSAGKVPLVVELLIVSHDVGDHESWIASLPRVLGLGDQRA